MGQKIHPNGFRVGIIKDWDSRWFASKKDFANYLVEDDKIRKFLINKLNDPLVRGDVSRINIERAASKVTVNIFTAKPGIVIGKGGAGVEQLKAEVSKLCKKQVNINIIEIRNRDVDAQLIALNIAEQLEKRIAFRRAMKQAMDRAMKAGAKGIKLKCSGRLGGAEIARDEGYHRGSTPLQTLRADIDYGFAEAKTTYGRIGVKVWIYKGEVLTKGIVSAAEAAAKLAQEQAPRRPRRTFEGGNKRVNA